MPTSDFARVDFVVIKILAQHPFVVTHQTMGSDHRRIELNLNLHLPRDCHRRSIYLLRYVLFHDGVRDPASPESDADQPMRICPGTTRDLDIDREQFVRLRSRIIVGEIVNHFLDSHRIFWRQQTVTDEPSNGGVGGDRILSVFNLGFDCARSRWKRSTSLVRLSNFFLSKSVTSKNRQPNHREKREHSRNRERSGSCPEPGLIADL